MKFSLHLQHRIQALVLFAAAVCLHLGTVSQAEAQRLPVTEIDKLSFGRFAPGVGGGTVVFPANGNVSSTGTVVHLNGQQKGLVTVRANAGDTVEVRVRNGNVTGPGRRMQFVSSCIGPGGTLGVGRCRFTATGGDDAVLIGGELSVRQENNQTPGIYTGTMRVTARRR